MTQLEHRPQHGIICEILALLASYLQSVCVCVCVCFKGGERGEGSAFSQMSTVATLNRLRTRPDLEHVSEQIGMSRQFDGKLPDESVRRADEQRPEHSRHSRWRHLVHVTLAGHAFQMVQHERKCRLPKMTINQSINTILLFAQKLTRGELANSVCRT